MRAWILGAVILIGCKTDATAPSDRPLRVWRRPALSITPPPAKGLPSSIARDPWAPQSRDQNQDGEVFDGDVSDDAVVVARYERAERLHARLDRDRDGEVNVAELGEYLWVGDVGPISVRLYRKDRPVFDPAADLDDDGAVSVDEIDSWLAQAPH